MREQTPAEHELAELIVRSLNLQGVQAVDIDPQESLFDSDLGLDSIDTLELAMAVSRKYGFQVHSNSTEHRREIFATLSSLSAYIQTQRVS